MMLFEMSYFRNIIMSYIIHMMSRRLIIITSVMPREAEGINGLMPCRLSFSRQKSFHIHYFIAHAMPRYYQMHAAGHFSTTIGYSKYAAHSSLSLFHTQHFCRHECHFIYIFDNIVLFSRGLSFLLSISMRRDTILILRFRHSFLYFAYADGARHISCH